MATLIPMIQWDAFKKLTPYQLKRLQSVEIYSGEDYVFTFTNPQTEYIRVEAEHKAQLSNSVGGQSYEAVTTTPQE